MSGGDSRGVGYGPYLMVVLISWVSTCVDTHQIVLSIVYCMPIISHESCAKRIKIDIKMSCGAGRDSRNNLFDEAACL